MVNESGRALRYSLLVFRFAYKKGDYLHMVVIFVELYCYCSRLRI